MKTWLARIGCESIPVMQTQESAANIMKEKAKMERMMYRLFLLGRRRRTDELQGASESQFHRLPVMECLTLRATVYTDEMLSHNSAEHRHASQQRNSFPSR